MFVYLYPTRPTFVRGLFVFSTQWRRRNCNKRSHSIWSYIYIIICTPTWIEICPGHAYISMETDLFLSMIACFELVSWPINSCSGSTRRRRGHANISYVRCQCARNMMTQTPGTVIITHSIAWKRRFRDISAQIPKSLKKFNSRATVVDSVTWSSPEYQTANFIDL